MLVFEDARQRHGGERMTAFLRGAYARFVRDGHATTAALLDEAEAQFGREGREEIQRALHRTDWRPTDGGPAYVFSARDAAWLGTWVGTLTQGSITHPVVLRLRRQGDELAGTLDHPDPTAPALTLAVVRIDNGVLRFALGAFDIPFKGALNAGATTIDGEWTQGGASYRVVLARRAREIP